MTESYRQHDVRKWVAIVGVESALFLALLFWWLLGGAAEMVAPDAVLHGSQAAASIEGRSNAAASGDVDRASSQPIAFHSAPPSSGEARDLVLVGTVCDDEGRPIVGAEVMLDRDGVYAMGRAASNGAYATPGLSAGEWNLRCTADGFAAQSREMRLDERPWQRLDLVMRPWHRVLVRIQDPEGVPFASGIQGSGIGTQPTFVATREPIPGHLPPTSRMSIERFGVGEWHPFDRSSEPAALEAKARGFAGELLLGEDPPYHAALLLRHLVLQSQRIEVGQRELVFTLDPAVFRAAFGTVKLRLIDGSTSAPLAGISLRCTTTQGGGAGGTTDERGFATIEHVLPGPGILNSLMMQAPLEHLVMPVEVPSGDVLDLGDITLTPATNLRGRLVDVQGRPVLNATVRCKNLDIRDPIEATSGNRQTKCDGDGRFEWSGAGHRRYLALAFASEGDLCGFAVVDARSGTAPEVEIRMVPGTRVSARARADSRTFHWMAMLADGIPIARVRVGAAGYEGAVQVAPGEYTLQVFDEQRNLVHSAPLKVGKKPLTIEVP